MIKPNTVSELRKRTGLSRVKFAERYGLKLRSVEDWERHEKHSTPDNLVGRRIPPYRLEALTDYVMSDIEPSRLQQMVGLDFIGDLTVAKKVSNTGARILEITSSNLSALNELYDLIMARKSQSENAETVARMSRNEHVQLLSNAIGLLQSSGITKPDVNVKLNGDITVTLTGDDIDLSAHLSEQYKPIYGKRDGMKYKQWRFNAVSVDEFRNAMGI